MRRFAGLGRLVASGTILACACNTGAAAQARTESAVVGSRSAKISDRLIAWATIWGDAERKGVYTCEEWQRYATRLFNDADKNHDGYVDAQEFKSIQQADPMLRESDLGYFDDNHDGRLSRSEFVNRPNPFFVRFDRKGTCRVTLDDLLDTASPADKSRARRIDR